MYPVKTIKRLPKSPRILGHPRKISTLSIQESINDGINNCLMFLCSLTDLAMSEVMTLLFTLLPYDRAFLIQFLLHFNEILSIQFSNHFYRFPWRVVVLKVNRKKDRYDVSACKEKC